MLLCLFLYANESCDFRVIFDHAQSSARESVTKRKRYLFIFFFISIDPSLETVILCKQTNIYSGFWIKKLPSSSKSGLFQYPNFFTLIQTLLLFAGVNCATYFFETKCSCA